jgi:hypothetical protein
MLIQEFRFQIQFIKGEENEIVDSFSRNCPRERPEDAEELNAIELEFLHCLEGEETPRLVVEEEDEINFLEFLDQDCELYFLPTEDEDELMEIDMESPIPDHIYDAIEAVHNTQSGHKGVKATEHRLRVAGVKIKYARQWIERFIHECAFCQKQSYKVRKAQTLPFTLSQTQQVMQRLNVDAIGPLEEDANGFKYILTVIDTFSRWVMAYPMRSLESQEIVRNLIWHFGIFGIPVELLTDQGSSLKSKLVTGIVQLLDIRHKISVAYSHQENGIVERWNHEVVRYLRAMVFDSNSVDNWSELLPLAQRICNAEVCESIGVAPAQIIFGSAINLDRSVLTPNTESVPHMAEEHPEMSE